MSLAQIAVIVIATAVPFFLWGYKRGYKKATADTEGKWSAKAWMHQIKSGRRDWRWMPSRMAGGGSERNENITLKHNRKLERSLYSIH